VNVHWRAVELPDGLETPANEPKGVIGLLELWVDWSLLWTANTPLASRPGLDISMVRYTRRQEAPWGEARDYSAEIFRGGGEFTEGINVEGGAGSVHFAIAQVENAMVHGMYVSASAGFAAASAGKLDTDNKREVEVVMPRVSLKVERGERHVHAHLQTSLDAVATPDGYVTKEWRTTAGAGIRFDATNASVAAALARTWVYLPGTPRTVAHTGGLSLSVSRELSEHLQATALVDAGRTFYAPDAMQLDFSPRWAVQAFATLQATVGR
jgi:hypothetical protein